MVNAIARQLLKSPLLHCLATGLVLFWLATSSETTPDIVISQEQINALKNQWQLKTGRQPNLARTQQLLDDYIDQEIVIHEALDRQFDQLPVVRDRLQKLGSFLNLIDGNAEDQEREALKLGLLKTDPLIRRYMISAVKETLFLQLPVKSPSQDDIQQFYELNRESYRLPERLKLSHVYIGGLTEQSYLRADKLLSELGNDINLAITLGDPFYNGHRLPAMAGFQLEKRMGAEFVSSIQGADTGQWFGPVRSSYGYHLVLLEERSSSGYQTISLVEDKIRSALLRHERKRAFDQWLQHKRSGYTIHSIATDPLPSGNERG